ncbi:thiamine pyrophosphate-dependent enzyme [Chloroflexota bacterium]
MVTETKIHPLVEKYFRIDRMPHLACPGCGIGMVMQYTLMSVDELGIDPEKFAWVTGVGCSSRLPYAVWKGDCVDATHGRPMAMATGLKLARPELTVLVYTGDGDCLSIGGNHFIHACRRNVPVTVVMFNNQIYGMTGGQVAPTTPRG